jgi:hypothetical protein
MKGKRHTNLGLYNLKTIGAADLQNSKIEDRLEIGYS